MAAGKYLRLRGGIYHCRIRVPRKLRFAFKKVKWTPDLGPLVKV